MIAFPYKHLARFKLMSKYISMIASIILATLSANAFSQDVIECGPVDVMKAYWGDG